MAKAKDATHARRAQEVRLRDAERALDATSQAYVALDAAREVLDEIDGCPEGTTCPTCMPIRQAAKLAGDAHMAAHRWVQTQRERLDALKDGAR